MDIPVAGLTMTPFFGGPEFGMRLGGGGVEVFFAAAVAG